MMNGRSLFTISVTPPVCWFLVQSTSPGDAFMYLDVAFAGNVTLRNSGMLVASMWYVTAVFVSQTASCVSDAPPSNAKRSVFD